jgi:signal transduction histidine kinase
LEQKVERLQRQNEELRQFAYAVAHDLKAPLVTTASNLAFLEADVAAGKTARIHEDVAEMRSAVERMKDLVTELLELARLGRLDLTTVGGRPAHPVSLADVVAEALLMLKGAPAASRADIAIVSPLPVVNGRNHQLIEVYQNLIENAAKFATVHTAPRVEIGAEIRAGDPVLFVRDNGRGIPPADRERVFELFVQLDASGEGTGIGLAIVRRIITAHGGKVWIEEGIGGRGAAFCFTLPRVEGET